MAKKNLPPIAEHPLFRGLVDDLKKQPQSRVNIFLEALEDESFVSETTSGQEKETRSKGEVGNYC